MTEIEKAIDVLKRLRITLAVHRVDGYRVFEPLTAGIEALEKQAGKKPACRISDKDFKIGNLTFKKGSKRYNCICGNLISYSYTYCPYCGQKIKWED